MIIRSSNPTWKPLPVSTLCSPCKKPKIVIMNNRWLLSIGGTGADGLLCDMLDIESSKPIWESVRPVTTFRKCYAVATKAYYSFLVSILENHFYVLYLVK